MTEHEDLSAAEGRASRACAETVTALRRAGIQPEALAEYVPEGRRLFVLPKAATMKPIGEAWRLGSLLIDTAGTLWAAGRATRAFERGRPGYQSASREERRDIAAAALRGGFPEAAPVNFDARQLPLHGEAVQALSAEEPIGWADGEIRVRWRAGAPLEGAPTLASYLHERAELLVHPPISER